MNINQAGLDLIKSFEGLRLEAYRCSANVLTIGFGHTSAAGEPKVTSGLTITNEQAEEILRRDLGKYERAVINALRVEPSENQFAAMVSLCYNIGPGAFARSSVVKRMNAGNPKGAAEAITMWNKAGGRVLRGLVRRREAERALFLSDEPSEDIPITGRSTAIEADDPVAAMMQEGDKGEAVKTQQLFLNALGFDVAPDGDFGPKTLAAVRSFQTRKGLTADGIIGPDTMSAISEAVIAAVQKPEAIEPPKPKKPRLPQVPAVFPERVSWISRLIKAITGG